MDNGAADQRVRRIGDDVVGRLEPSDNLDVLTIVAPNRDRHELRLIVAHDRDPQALATKQQRI